jgi:hypothetical protein
MSTKADHGQIVQWYGRLYDAGPNNRIDYDENGKVLNTELWHDPKIDTEDNLNVILDVGRAFMGNTLFALAGSGNIAFMAAGASSTSAVHTQTQLVYELIADTNRAALTNTDGTSPLTSAKVVTASSFSDSTYSPPYAYYYQWAVMAQWNGAVSLNVNQPFQEFALNDTKACPGTNTGTSGHYLDRYVFGSPVTLGPTTILQVTAIIRV